MIDIIIPAYNAEDTIGKTLASIASQTKQRKFLVTVVDDCSTDNTEEIVNKFKGILPLQYIKLEKNLGKPGLVRNKGIEKTHCPYILFLDADDMLEPVAAEFLVRASIQKKPDMIVGSFLVETDEEKEEERYQVYGKNALTWLHGNLYRRDFLEENNIMFDDRLNEDGSFNLKCINLSKNTIYIETPVACWLNNKKSLTRGNKEFMIDIAGDYIETYTDAIKFILEKKSELCNDKTFLNTCSYKLSEFCEFIEAAYFYKKDIDKLLKLLENFIKLVKEYEMLNKHFILGANERYNMTKIFPNMLRTHNFMWYLDILKINYEGVFK